MTARGARPLEGYVLHRYDWSESSLILEVFTRESGRLAVAAKGAKRPYSQLRPVLLPFQRLHLSLVRPRSAESAEAAEVQTLRHADWAGGQAMLGGAALYSGFYCNELLMKLLPRQDPHPRVFDAYADTLPGLVAADDLRAQAALRAFELVLLRDIGLLPQLDRVTLTLQPLVAAQRYALLPESGVMATREEPGSLNAGTLTQLQQALDAQSLAELQVACLGALSPLRGALRALLHYHLGSPVLRTRQVMQGVQRWIDVATLVTPDLPTMPMAPATSTPLPTPSLVLPPHPGSSTP